MRRAPDIALNERPDRLPTQPIRVMVVDDSPTVRAVMGRLLNAEGEFEVVASEPSAERALITLGRMTVDVILLDLDMPGMGGLEAIGPLLRAAEPARILVVSSLTVRGAEHTLNALSLGAADTLAKPRSSEFGEEYRTALLRKVGVLGRVARKVREQRPASVRPRLRSPAQAAPQIIAIGASTGGIHALGQLLAALPGRVSVPILVTQHLPSAFTEAFVRQVQAASGRGTLVARSGMAVLPGQIVVAPGDAHLTVADSGRGETVVRLDTAPAPSGCRPSVDPMFASCAALYGRHAWGVLLSGMGRDGAIGAERIVAAGGSITAQDAPSCAVWGMPGAVVEAGLACAVLPPPQIAAQIAAAVGVR